MNKLLLIILSLFSLSSFALGTDRKIDERGYWLDRSFATHINWAVQDQGTVHANIDERCVVIVNPKKNEMEVLYGNGSRYLGGEISRTFENNGVKVVESVISKGQIVLRLSINNISREARVLYHRKGRFTQELCTQAKQIN